MHALHIWDDILIRVKTELNEGRTYRKMGITSYHVGNSVTLTLYCVHLSIKVTLFLQFSEY